MVSRSVTDEMTRVDRAFEADDDTVWPAPLVSIELGHPIAVETWGTADEIVADHCSLGRSGTLRIDGDPGVRVYLHDGLVYFAERTTDPELGFRLVLDGVISEDQLVHGTRLLEGGRHLGRMFANDPTIDRQLVVDEVVGYCADAVGSLRGRAVSTYAFLPEEHHSSGILAWYSLDDEVDTPSAADLVPAAPLLATALVATEPVPAPAVAVSASALVPAAPTHALASDRIPPVRVRTRAPAPIATVVEPVASSLSDWLGPIKFEPLVELDVDFDLEPLLERDDVIAPAVREARLPRRSRFDESIPLATEHGLGEVNISALQAAMTSIRASNSATATLTTRETATPAVSPDAEVANEKVPGSPAERRLWVARRHR
jgi:hypothetical protein